jgi:hypothetical protein
MTSLQLYRPPHAESERLKQVLILRCYLIFKMRPVGPLGPLQVLLRTRHEHLTDELD